MLPALLLLAFAAHQQGYLTSKDICQMFIDYILEHDHVVWLGLGLGLELGLTLTLIQLQLQYRSNGVSILD